MKQGLENYRLDSHPSSVISDTLRTSFFSQKISHFFLEIRNRNTSKDY